MIRIIERQYVDEDKWNQCIANSSIKLPYSYLWYLDIICDDYLCLVEADYAAVMPLPIRRRWRLCYVYTPYFAQQLGVYSATQVTEERLHRFISAIPSHVKYLDQYINHSNPSGNDNIVEIRHSSHLELRGSYEEIYQSYNSNTKRNLKKAADFSIEEDIKHDNIIESFRHKISDKESGLGPADYQRLHSLMGECSDRGIGKSTGLKLGDELAAAVFYILTEDHIIWLFPTSSEKHKDSRALFYLLDRVIQRYAGTDRTLDLEGSMIPSIQRFYDGFGAKKVFYSHLRINRLPWYLRLFK